MVDYSNAPIRHGEILLMPSPPPRDHEVGVVERTTEAVVGHSESGHHHVLECSVAIEVIHADATYVRIARPGTLVQRKEVDRHRDLPVPAGLYVVLTKTEYDPFEGVRRQVAD